MKFEQVLPALRDGKIIQVGRGDDATKYRLKGGHWLERFSRAKDKWVPAWNLPYEFVVFRDDWEIVE